MNESLTALADVPCCALHLRRDAPSKDIAVFDELLARDREERVRNGARVWILEGIISPREWRGDVLAIRHNDGLRCFMLRSDFSEANLLGAYLESAGIISCCFDNVDLRFAVLDNAQILDTQMRNCMLENASLTDVHLSGVEIEGTDLGRLARFALKEVSGGPFVRAYAEMLLRVRNNFAVYGRQEQADEFYLKEMRARRKMLRDHREYFASGRKSEHTLNSMIEQCKKRARSCTNAILSKSKKESKGFAHKLIRQLVHLLAVVHSGLRHPLFAVREYPRFAGFRVRQFLSWLFDKVARYGNSPGRAFAVALLVMLLCASLLVIHTREPWPFLESLFHSVSAFTTLGMTVKDEVLKDDFVRGLTMIEAWIGSMIMAIFLFSLGRKALR